MQIAVITLVDIIYSPDRIRTGVNGSKARYPWPLDDRAVLHKVISNAIYLYYFL